MARNSGTRAKKTAHRREKKKVHGDLKFKEKLDTEAPQLA